MHVGGSSAFNSSIGAWIWGVIMAQQHSHPQKQKWPETQNSESTEGAKWCGRWRLLALGDWQIGQVQVDWKDSWPQLFHSDSSIWSYNPTINIIHLPEAKTSPGFGAEWLRKANTIIPLKPFVAWLHFAEKIHPSRFWGQLGPQKTETMSRRPTFTSLWRTRKWPLKKETVNANIATWVWCFPVVFGPLDEFGKQFCWTDPFFPSVAAIPNGVPILYII